MNKRFLSTGKIANSEKGALLLSVIVMIVIFGVLGAAILSITSTSTFTQAYSNNATKAYYMAESGFRYATMNIMTIGIGGDDCLKCHSSHGKETVRYSAGYGRLPDDTIKVHGKLYDDKDLLDGGSFEVYLAPFWFKAESLVDNNLTVSAVKTSDDFSEPAQCDFPEIFTDGTITSGGGLYIGGKYVVYTGIDVSKLESKKLIFESVTYHGSNYTLPAEELNVFPACCAKEQFISKDGNLSINVAGGELYAFPNKKSVIEIRSKDDELIKYLVTYEDVNIADGELTGLGNVNEDEDVFVDGVTKDKLSISEDDIVTLSKTLKIRSIGRYPVADANAAEKTLEYYRWVGKPMTVPIVYNTAKPDEGKLLAGGNFYWVSDVAEESDLNKRHTKGHNVFGVSGDYDLNLFKAPGQTVASGCGNVCHASIYDKDKPNGCAGCHLEPHPDVDADAGDEYCFLRGHKVGDGYGVTGIKDKDENEAEDGSDGDWQYSKSSSDHNEYRGIVGNGGKGLLDYPYTTTGYCTGCHGVFQRGEEDPPNSEIWLGQKDNNNDWILHPSSWPIDPTIKNEFADAFNAGGTGKGTYDPNVPVARPNTSTFDWTAPDSSVYLGEDMVMCLSCHVAHGSQYPDLLRWDYKDMIVGTSGDGQGEGCFKCHTDKDNSNYYTADTGMHCYDCHTMHNSQDGEPVANSGPNAHLLKEDPPPSCPHE